MASQSSSSTNSKFGGVSRMKVCIPPRAKKILPIEIMNRLSSCDTNPSSYRSFLAFNVQWYQIHWNEPISLVAKIWHCISIIISFGVLAYSKQCCKGRSVEHS
ncbi:3827_t:CDS:1 [Funneliformis mosseae]|uniref:3827_t:CDS:1 n=1 Tax=Funneliformis mosseae TaxID=27381 RepID=A0A9N9FF20_FUNMO|nr:3827_t:CDS:1 [Funneliformis mosseae]